MSKSVRVGSLGTKVTTVGVQGPARSSSLTTGLHIQSSASQTWTVNHGLGRKPIVGRREDDNGNSIGGIVKHIDDNTFELRFNEAVAGNVLYL